jgi:hypothetical protein
MGKTGEIRECRDALRMIFFVRLTLKCHCEERSDEAIHLLANGEIASAPAGPRNDISGFILA